LDSGCNLLHICGVVLNARWHVKSVLLEDVLARVEFREEMMKLWTTYDNMLYWEIPAVLSQLR
jgi:hypothetical protein